MPLSSLRKTAVPSAIAAVALALSGCRSHATYGVLASFPHKDVLHLTVLLEDRGTTTEYRAIAARELERFRGLREPAEHPLYQVQVEFRTDSQPYDLMAEVVTEMDNSDGDARLIDPSSWRVVLYASPER